jgi:hypothetical protein
MRKQRRARNADPLLTLEAWIAARSKHGTFIGNNHCMVRVEAGKVPKGFRFSTESLEDTLAKTHATGKLVQTKEIDFIDGANDDGSIDENGVTVLDGDVYVQTRYMAVARLMFPSARIMHADAYSPVRLEEAGRLCAIVLPIAPPSGGPVS